VLLVSVSQSSRKKRERDEDEEERKLWASLQETKEYLTVTAKNRRSLGKVRREREKTSAVLLKIRSKSSPPFSFAKVFISFIRLGAEKTSEEHDDAYSKRSFIHDLCPLSFYLFGGKTSQRRRDYRLLSRV